MDDDHQTRLSSLLRSGAPLSTPRAVEVVSATAERLDGLHARGVAHGNLQPETIVIRRDAETGSLSIQLGDAARPDGQLTAANYVAPEVIRGSPPNPKSDVYALGCVLYQCLAGQPPYERETREQTLRAHLHDAPRPVTFVRPDLPARVDEVVAAALAKNPANRFDTAPQLAADVRKAVSTRSHEAREGRSPPDREGSAPPDSAGISRRKVVIAALVALLLVAGAIIGALMLTGDSADLVGGVADDEAQLVQRIDPSTNSLVASVPTGRSFVYQTTIDGPRLWVADPFGGLVLQIDPSRNAVERAARVPGRPTDLAVDGEAVWFASVTEDPNEEGVVSRIDLRSWEIDSDVELRVRNPVAIEFGDGDIWVASAGSDQNALLRIDRTNGQVLALIPLEFEPKHVEFGEGAIWVAGGAAPNAGRPTFVARVDLQSNSVTGAVRLSGSSFIHLAVGEGAVWAATTGDGALTRINASGEVTTRIPGLRPSGIAAGEGALWMTDWIAGTLTRFDPGTNECLAIVDVGRSPRDPAAGAGGVWVSSSGPSADSAPQDCE